MLNGWRANFGYSRLFIGQSRLQGNPRACKEIAQKSAFRYACPSSSRPSGSAARQPLGRPSAVHFALSGLKRTRNSQRGQEEFPRNKCRRRTKLGMGVRWLWGALSVLVLWTVLDRETVIEKDIRAFELRSVEIMDTTGLSLLPSGWHPSLPAKCADHGGKQGPCPLGFCKGCPCSDTGCTLRHGLGPGLPFRRKFCHSACRSRQKEGMLKGTKEIFVKQFHRIRANLTMSVRSLE